MALVPLSYPIYLTSRAQVALLQQQYPKGIPIPPNTAASTYGATIGGQTPGVTYPGSFPQPPDGWTAATFTTNYGNATFNATSPDGLVFNFQWVGFFLYGNSLAQATPVGSPTPTVYLGSRLWADGGEAPNFAEGGSGNMASYVSRDASRTVDGMGYCYRAVSNIQRTHAQLANIRNVYERFYIRLRTLPTGEDEIWYNGGSVEAGTAAYITVNASGQLVAYNKGTGHTYTAAVKIWTTPALKVGVWYKIDLYERFSANGTSDPGQLQIAMNGVVTASGSGDVAGAGTGLTTQQYYRNSQLGNTGSVASTGLECDFDDWIGANEYLDAFGVSWGIDLTSGSHVKLFRATGFGALNSGWTGDWRTLLDNPVAGSIGTNTVATTTGSAKLDITTDYGDLQLGCPAFNVGAFNVTAPSVNMKLGWLIGGVETDNTVAITAGTWASVLNSVSNGTLRTALTRFAPLRVIFIKDAGGTDTEIQFLGGTQEIMGVFGQEDVV